MPVGAVGIHRHSWAHTRRRAVETDRQTLPKFADKANRPREAYRHLRAYAAIAPWNAWTWCSLGRACIDLGEHAEARDALTRALALEDDDDETGAGPLLSALGATAGDDAE